LKYGSDTATELPYFDLLAPTSGSPLLFSPAVREEKLWLWEGRVYLYPYDKDSPLLYFMQCKQAALDSFELSIE
jgi:hypothetical protein